MKIFLQIFFALIAVFLCNCFEDKAIPESPGDIISDSPDIQGPNNHDEQIVVNEELITPNGSNVDKLNAIFEGSGAGELYHEFTSEEIEGHRIITIHSNGTETISSDEEAILTLEYVRASESINFLHNEPHFVKQIHKRRVFGYDDRHPRNQNNLPYSAMGFLAVNGINVRCSAFLLGPRHLITAAHCLHPRGNTRNYVQPSQVSFYLRRACNPYRAGIRIGVQQILTYPSYRNNGKVEYDIALLLLSSTGYNWMGFAYRDPMPTVSGEVCGYSADRGQCFTCSHCSNIQRISTGWWGWGRNDNRLRYTCDILGGSSGGPVITDDHDSTSHLYAYGVNTHSGSLYNEGVRISRNIFYDICRWMCNTGASCRAVCR